MSKASTTDDKQLFPPGFKYPLSLLNERCQKNGWDKPVVATFPKDGGFAFSVTLRKPAKKSSDVPSVRLQPHIPYIRPSALEARHWGATYALYRICNNIQLNRILPPGPREYWSELAAEHKKAEPHQQWMYDQDPFRARRQVQERQTQAAAKKEKASHEPKVAKEFIHAPEVKMGSQLRTMVEDVIGQDLKEKIDPESSAESVNLPSDTLIKRHLALGFDEQDVRSAVNMLQRGSPFASNLLKEGSPDAACLEALLLLVPECRLPKRFLGERASTPFVTSMHRGDESVKLRWMQKIVVEQGGWPATFVSGCLSDLPEPELPALVRWLNHLLCPSIPDTVETLSDQDALVAKNERATEILALQSIYLGTQSRFEGSTQIFSVPIPSTGIQLSVCFSSKESYPEGHALCPIYLSSQTIPAFLRLHMLRRLLFRWAEKRLLGEPILLDAVQDVVAEWQKTQEHPPDSSEIMTFFQTAAPGPTTATKPSENSVVDQPELSQRSRKIHRKKVDHRNDAQVLAEFREMQLRPGFQKLRPIRDALPASKSRKEILKVLETSQVVIVKGDTGSGKTTQVPQFALDSMIQMNGGSRVNILVTQPRRLAALSVAARVSQERAEDGSVGYSIRGETKAGPKTKLLFCTTGVVLRRLASENGLDDVSHLIVDEVHERSVEIDLLLLEARELLKSRLDLKLILMSATIDITKFADYFNEAPLIEIPGRTFPVEDLYLEDIVSKLDYRCPPQIKPIHKWTPGDRQTFQSNLQSKAILDKHFRSLENLSRSDRVDYELIQVLVDHVISSRPEPCGILLFLSGTQEIRRCVEVLKASGISKKAELFQLHANLPSEEQQLVFKKYKKFKVIASTNVAETSITIDDVAVVIDIGKAKITEYDSVTGLVNLKEKWITVSAANQRRGRAGRSQAGQCYRLYTEHTMASFAPFLEPEILRMPLENVVLQCKAIRRDDDTKDYLMRALDPPRSDSIVRAIYLLGELRALNEDGTLSPIGEYMSRIPLDVRLAKMLILALVFHCVDPILTIASILSSKPLMAINPENRDDIAKIRLSYATMNSDLLADYRVYQECSQRRSESKNAFDTFCSENFISPSTVREINFLREELFQTVSEMALLPLDLTPTDPSLNSNSQAEAILKGVILAGLWPRVAGVHLPQKAIKYDQLQAGTVRRENEARQFQLFDIGMPRMRVFTHPGSVMFSQVSGKSSFLVYFNKHETTKVYIRDATEVPIYAILLFGGPLYINHAGGGIVVGGAENPVYLRAWPRIGVLVNRLRALLDAQLDEAINTARLRSTKKDTPLVEALLALLTTDGVSH